MNNSYFLLLDSGYIQLMAKKVITVRAAQPPKALESSGTPAKYHELPDSFYYKIGNGELMKVTSLRKMIETFPDKQEEMKQYAKKEKISVKRKEELMMLLKFYNSL